jgi:hypothetical protein
VRIKHKHKPVNTVGDQRNTGTMGVRKACECGLLMTVYAPYEHALLERKQIETVGGKIL